MFVAGDFMVDLSFPIAQASLTAAVCRGSLGRASEGAYGDGLADLTGSGHAGAALEMPELAEVRCRQLGAHRESAVLVLRWEACLPGGTLFPALDADITLAPVGGEATRFSLAGVYRPPPAWPSAGQDPGTWRRAAAATIRFFLVSLRAVLAGADAGDGEPDLACGRVSAERPVLRAGPSPLPGVPCEEQRNGHILTEAEQP